MENNPFYVRRTNLAQGFADRLQGNLSPADLSGLFLAAPRRTGKTSFLLEELVPELESRGILPVYVDLWEEILGDPESLIAKRLQSVASQFRPAIQKVAEKLGVNEIRLPWVAIDIRDADKTKNLSLAESLGIFSAAVERPVALLVDEAQQVLSEDHIHPVLFALKSARDQMRRASFPLYLLMTGSNRDKLAELTHNKRQPFYGSEVVHFPLLGDEFLSAFVQKVNAHLSSTEQLRIEDIRPAFNQVGHKPEAMWQILTETLKTTPPFTAKAFIDAAIRVQKKDWEIICHDYHGLTDIQKAVLEVLLAECSESATVLTFGKEFSSRVGVILGKNQVPPGTIQRALEKLRKEHWVWKSMRGLYLPEDESFVQWYQAGMPG